MAVNARVYMMGRWKKCEISLTHFKHVLCSHIFLHRETCSQKFQILIHNSFDQLTKKNHIGNIDKMWLIFMSWINEHH